MRKQKRFNLMTEEELQKINHEIVPLFGVQNRVTSGSILLNKGKTQYHIVVGDTFNYNSQKDTENIGIKVKEILGAHEVYSYGVKLA